MKQLVLLLLVYTSFISCKNMESKVNEHNSSSQWISLFDGSNLDQWRGYLSEEMPAEWTIEDGNMAFTPGSRGGKNIITKEAYTNFILSLEWKISEGGNSGIFWGVYEDKKFGEPYQTGPEIQVLDNERHPDSFVANGTHKAGSLYDMIAYPPADINPAGQWNLCILEVNHRANLAKVTMNNGETISFPLQGAQWDHLIENSKFKGWEGFGKYQTGHIGLQDHSDKVWYRNIKIKKLDK